MKDNPTLAHRDLGNFSLVPKEGTVLHFLAQPHIAERIGDASYALQTRTGVSLEMLVDDAVSARRWEDQRQELLELSYILTWAAETLNDVVDEVPESGPGRTACRPEFRKMLEEAIQRYHQTE